ncbi:MAG: hypothetical protein NW217_03985 [Hyphomicrobiaceae bacterium]|nr:hypothetical protein [Hyphomicrobiaceae bacterium]
MKTDTADTLAAVKIIALASVLLVGSALTSLQVLASITAGF